MAEIFLRRLPLRHQAYPTILFANDRNGVQKEKFMTRFICSLLRRQV